ncbi:MAG: hypothetical protein ACRCZK_01805 [Oscillospiraceae bacterium]
MKNTINIEYEFKLIPKNEYDNYNRYRLLINNDNIDTICFEKKSGKTYGYLFERHNHIFGVENEDYDTLDKAIALWGLEDPRVKKSVWELESGDYYYYLSNIGIIHFKVWTSSPTDLRKREIGNCFLTEEEALKEIERQEAEVKLLKIIADYNNGWLPNWEDKEEIKFYLYFDSNDVRIDYIRLPREYSNEWYIKNRNFPITIEVIILFKLAKGIE